MKHLQQFKLNENRFDDDDFNFETKLTHGYIYFNNHSEEYDDYDQFAAKVYWKLRFEWMGDSGLDYYFEVDKVELEYLAITHNEDGSDDEEEKSLIIENPDNITFEKTSTDNQQLMVQSIDIDGVTVNVEF